MVNVLGEVDLAETTADETRMGEIINGNKRGQVRVCGSIFTGSGKPGDFQWMIEQPEYDRTLFVFNDNEEQFLAYMNGDYSRASMKGGGNAVIRPYQYSCPIPRAAGIPTGADGIGYDVLDNRVRAIIDQAIDGRIGTMLASGLYSEIVFSKDPNRETLGTGIFNPSDKVKDYVYSKLMCLVSE